MAAIYKGIEFPTRLLATWAAFFDLAGWKWTANPAAIGDWKPDFLVSFECGHSECPATHQLLASVLPVKNAQDFGAHPCLAHAYEGLTDVHGRYVADAGAALGVGPWATTWTMSHGAGGGVSTVSQWVENSSKLWADAEQAIGV